MPEVQLPTDLYALLGFFVLVFLGFFFYMMREQRKAEKENITQIITLQDDNAKEIKEIHRSCEDRIEGIADRHEQKMREMSSNQMSVQAKFAEEFKELCKEIKNFTR